MTGMGVPYFPAMVDYFVYGNTSYNLYANGGVSLLLRGNSAAGLLGTLALIVCVGIALSH
jgi:hypothetical protein